MAEIRRAAAVNIEHTKDGTPASRDWRFTTNLRDAIGSACRNQSEGFYKYWHSEQRPLFNIARGSLGETKDGIQEGLAMVANLRWLKSLKRRDPNWDRGDRDPIRLRGTLAPQHPPEAPEGS